jgi:hypothetical protein
MKNTNMSESHLLIDKMNVDLYVLRGTVLNVITCHIDGTHIVTIDNDGRLKRKMQVLK